MSLKYDREPKEIPVDPPLRKPVEIWAQEKKTPAWLFAAARAGQRWASGREITESEFDTAVKATGSISIGYHLTK